MWIDFFFLNNCNWSYMSWYVSRLWLKQGHIEQQLTMTFTIATNFLRVNVWPLPVLRNHEFVWFECLCHVNWLDLPLWLRSPIYVYMSVLRDWNDHTINSSLNDIYHCNLLRISEYVSLAWAGGTQTCMFVCKSSWVEDPWLVCLCASPPGGGTPLIVAKTCLQVEELLWLWPKLASRWRNSLCGGRRSSRGNACQHASTSL